MIESQQHLSGVSSKLSSLRARNSDSERTILKLTALAEGDRLLASSSVLPSTQSRESEAVVQAMHRLVDILAQLRSPASGWPADVQPTPENLTPYVLEEVYEVVDALHERAISENTRRKSEESALHLSPFTLYTSPFILVEDLIPRLLWYIVRSSYDIMRLIGGVKARVFQLTSDLNTENLNYTPSNDRGWRIGTVRLVAGLGGTPKDDRDVTDFRWLFDLTTHQSYRSTDAIAYLGEDTLIHCDEVNLCQKPIGVENLSQQLRQQIEAVAPQVAEFMQPRLVEWLEPGQLWQTGEIQLTMDFEFFPAQKVDATEETTNSEDSKADATEEMTNSEDSEEDDRSWLLAAEFSETPLKQKIRLSPRASLQEYRNARIAAQLVDAVSQLQEVYEAGSTSESSLVNSREASSDFITQLVATANEVVDAIASPSHLSNPEERNFAPEKRSSEIAIDELIHRLLWHIIGSSYAVMQLCSGVKANLLEPESDWQTGTLRLVAIFNIQTPSIDCYIDLATGETPQNSTTLASSAIIQSYDLDLCGQLRRVENLLSTSIEQIRATSPALGEGGIIASLLAIHSTRVDLLQPAQKWESGVAALSLHFEFLPDFRGNG